MIPRKQTDYQPLETHKRELFSTPFYLMRFNYNLQEIVYDVRKAISALKMQDDPSRNYTTYFERDVHDDIIARTDWCKQLTTNLKDTYVDIMHKEFLKDPRHLKMKRKDLHCFLWVNRYTSDHEHNAHNHKGSILSGTFYVKCQHPCSPIIFESPTEYHNMLFQTEDRTHTEGQLTQFGVPAIQKEFQYHPKDGDIAMWPSYLYHHVPRQVDQEERISISFNLAHQEEYGTGATDEVLDELDYGFLTHE